MRKVQTRLTRRMPRHLRTEKRILELLEMRDCEFGELCVALDEHPNAVHPAVKRLVRCGWIQLVPSGRHAVYHAVTGALVGWTREQGLMEMK